MNMTRSENREHSFRILFESEFLPDVEKDQLVEDYLAAFPEEKVTESDRRFISGEVRGTLEHVEEIDAKISSVLRGWTLERIARVDRAILRLALYEIDYTSEKDIPASVSINEAVELAKKYSPNDTGAFVNGVLANFAKKSDKKDSAEKEA